MDPARLEEQIAHLHRMVEDMSDELARRGAEIDRLSRQVALLMEREATRQQDEQGGATFTDERPPHW